MFAGLAQDDCVSRCRAEEAQGAMHIVSCEQGCGVSPTTIGLAPGVWEGSREAQRCSWYQSPTRMECPTGQMCAAVVSYSGCHTNWFMVGGIAAAAFFLLGSRQ